MPTVPRPGYSPRRHWQLVSWPSRLLFLLAVFFTFSSIGFITDILSLGGPSLEHRFLAVVSSGAIAVGAAHGSMSRRPWWTGAILVASAIALPLLLSMVDSRGGVHAIVQFPSAGLVTWRFQLDAVGCLVCMVLGYLFFVLFIARELNRSARLQAEMSLAQDLHSATVPTVELQTERYELFGRSIPAAEVGGDLVDVVAHGGTLTTFVADVSGHGVAAGALMGMFKSAARMKLLEDTTLESPLADLNQIVFQVRRPNSFISGAFCELREAGWFSYGLAGHLPILHLRMADARVERLSVRQSAFGVKRDESFRTSRIPVASGDIIALITDGLTEVSDKKGAQLGIDWIEGALIEGSRKPLPEIFDSIIKTAHAHGQQADDQTMLLLRFR